MQLVIENLKMKVYPGESLAELLRREGIDSADLNERPLAALIGGEVFPLNCIPLVQQGMEEVPDEKIEKALDECDGKVGLLRYRDEQGRRVYERGLLFIFFLACRRLFPGTKVKVHYALGPGLYCVIGDRVPSGEDIENIRQEMNAIVRADYSLNRQRMDIDKAAAFFEEDGQEDKVRLLSWRPFSFFDTYGHGDYRDYFYGEMTPATGYISAFDIIPYGDGILLVRPSAKDPNTVAEVPEMLRMYATMQESVRRDSVMHCVCVADLNEMTEKGTVRELVRLNEALHEKRYAQIADSIVGRDAKVVLLAGPSSSGKTTSANRLCTQLRVLGKTPVMFSLDDYYRDRDKVEREPDGSIDLEHIRCIDTDLFADNLKDLLEGKEIEIPTFNFLTQKREWNGRRLKIAEDMIVVIEGLHALNPSLLGEGVDKSKVYRLYVSALTTLNLDDHNRIPTTDIRLLRRLVRDYETRGASMEHTLSMWESVRRGEEQWIFPYQETADAMIDSSLVYEPVVLKKHLFPLLSEVKASSPCYAMAIAVIKFLNYFCEADLEDEIPPTSVLREFIGGNSFYR